MHWPCLEDSSQFLKLQPSLAWSCLVINKYLTGMFPNEIDRRFKERKKSQLLSMNAEALALPYVKQG